MKGNMNLVPNVKSFGLEGFAVQSESILILGIVICCFNCTGLKLGWNLDDSLSFWVKEIRNSQLLDVFSKLLLRLYRSLNCANKFRKFRKKQTEGD